MFCTLATLAVAATALWLITKESDDASTLSGAPWRRLAVVGDSIAEGVREPHVGYRDLSWIDRIAESLPGLEVLNLGRRNLLAREVLASQLDAALAFRPDLAIVAAGGNDALRRSFDARRSSSASST